MPEDIPEPPRVMWLWGYQMQTECYAFGAVWSRVPPEERKHGLEFYRKQAVFAWNPHAWREARRNLKRLVSVAWKVRK